MRTLLRELLARLLLFWPAKLASVIVAVALWVYVLNQQDPVMTQQASVAVRAENVPERLALLGLEPPAVTVTVRGRRSVLRELSSSLAASVDLSGAGPGAQQLPLRLRMPPGIKLLQAEPQHVTVKLDEAVSMQRPVLVETRGVPSEGYQIRQLQVSPAGVTVEGPNSLVERVAKVVAVVDVSGLEGSSRRTATVEARDSAGLPLAGVRLKPAQVTVDVLAQVANVKAVPVWPRLSDPPAGWRLVAVTPRPPVVVVSGPPSVLAGLATVTTETVPLDAERRRATFTARLRVPNNVSLVGPAFVRVEVVMEPLGAGVPSSAPLSAPVPPAAQAAPQPSPSVPGRAPQGAPSAPPTPGPQ
jgi:YbbR domain-containing protein